MLSLYPVNQNHSGFATSNTFSSPFKALVVISKDFVLGSLYPNHNLNNIKKAQHLIQHLAMLSLLRQPDNIFAPFLTLNQRCHFYRFRACPKYCQYFNLAQFLIPLLHHIGLHSIGCFLCLMCLIYMFYRSNKNTNNQRKSYNSFF